MKTFITFCFLLFVNIALQAQCSKTAPLQNDPSTTITGSAIMEFKTNGTKILKLSNDFSVTSGPDLDVYLATNTKVANSNQKINLGALKNFTGAQEYTIPSSVNFNQYSHVIIHCTAYNHHFGQGAFGTPQGNDCATLATENLTKKVFRIYPNPVQNQLKIEGLNTSATIKIYSILGKLVSTLKKDNLQTNGFSVAKLPSGLYITHIITNNKNTKVKFQKK